MFIKEKLLNLELDLNLFKKDSETLTSSERKL